MSDDTSAPKKPRTTKPSTTPFERAVTGDSAEPEPTRVEPVETAAPEATPPEPVVEEPAAASTVGAQPQAIYISQPAPPTKQGNRGFGVVVALLATVIFGVILTGATLLIGFFTAGVFDFVFLGQYRFYVPILLFAVGFVLVILIANRANWGAYIVGSILIGLFVYFGTAAIGMLADGVIQRPEEAGEIFRTQLVHPFVIVSGLLAREVSMWAGVSISRRGRTVRARNAEARDAYERDVEEKKAERERLTGVSA